MKKLLLKLTALLLASLLLLSALACSGAKNNENKDALSTSPASAAPTASSTETLGPEKTPEPVPTPNPSREPDPSPTPESYELVADICYIADAFPLIETIGAIHNTHYSIENAFFNRRAMYYEPGTGYHLYMRIRFVSDEPGQILEIDAVPDNRGEISFSIADIHMCDPDMFDPESWYASYPDEVWQEYTAYMDERETVVITPEDIAAAGCTETEGEEYLLAIGRCYQQKLCELFTDMPENYPGHCCEMRPISCETILSEDGQQLRLRLGFASLPKDLRLIFNRFAGDTYTSNFADESYPPEIFGWLITYGNTDLKKQADGSWVGTTRCHESY